MSINIKMVQLNPYSGDVKKNAEKILKIIENLKKQTSDLIIFPEFALNGYPVGDAISYCPVLSKETEKQLFNIAEKVDKTTVVLGFLEEKNNKKYSSVAVISNGEIKKVIRCSEIVKNKVFSDYEYISEYNNEQDRIIEINGVKFGIFIGQEIIKNNGYDAVINCSSTFENINFNSDIPVLFVNRCGVVDNIPFVEPSKLINNGKVLTCAKYLEEDILTITSLDKIQKINKYYKKPDLSEFTLDYEDDMERTYKTLIWGIKDYFEKTGFKHAVLGLSGGLDSTICATLLSDAIGAENVYGISMPSKITSDESKNDAKILAKNLGINFYEKPIKELVDNTSEILNSLFSDIEQDSDFRYKKSYTSDNIQARMRAMYIWGVSNEFASCLPIATSDKSECYMGYATVNGDMSGGYAPIADVTKTKLFALAKWINKNTFPENRISQNIINKRPGAELAIDEKTGKPLIAEDALMPYDFLDEMIWIKENTKLTIDEIMQRKFIYETTHSVSTEQKREWVRKFYRRMTNALYKRNIMPPFVLVDTKIWTQPVTSSGIKYEI